MHRFARAPSAVLFALFALGLHELSGGRIALGQTDPPVTDNAADTQPATPRPLTLHAIYDTKDFDDQTVRGIEWTDNPALYRERRDGRLMRIDARSGQPVGPDFDDESLRAALAAHPDFDDDAAASQSRRPARWSADRSTVLINHNDRWYSYRFDDGRLRRIARNNNSRREVDLSPAGRYISYVLDNDLYVIRTTSGSKRRLTRGGGETLLNGVLDWVYQEELYGRGNWRGYWWSPDERHIAFLQLDQSGVPTYTIINNVPGNGPVETMRYPRPGDPNPRVRLGVASLGLFGGVRWIDLSKYDGMDILIVAVSWSPDGRLLFSVQDREQRWLELNEVHPSRGRLRTLIREESAAWVDTIAHPHWLSDGSFLWQSERDGRRHLYHYARDGSLLRRVTQGPWDVRSLHGVDERDGRVYFSGSYDTVLETHAYRVPLSGGAPQRLTTPGNTHRVNFNADYSMFISAFSNIQTPAKTYLHSRDGGLVRVLAENEMPKLREYRLAEPELLQIPASDGTPLNALLIRPPDFTPSRRYPVLCEVYAGPAAPSVRNRWLGKGGLVRHMLATEGFLVLYVDPRSAAGDAESAWTAYRRLGVQELADIEDALRWLIDRGWADPARIAIQGFSYGGFMTCYALTHSKMFKLGIAGGKVSDWRNYDSIYTERFMQTPQNNPDGYERTSVVKAAESLHGRLLLVHGMMDDNVHFLNAGQLIDALQKAGREFDLMLYPRDRHGIHHGGRHFRELWVDYIRRRL